MCNSICSINISTVWLSECDVSVHYLVFLFLLNIVLQCTEVKLFVLWETTLTHMRYFFLYAFTSFCGLPRKRFVLRWNFGGISFSDPSPLSDQMFREGNLTSSPLAFLSVIRRVGMLFLVVTKACFFYALPNPLVDQLNMDVCSRILDFILISYMWSYWRHSVWMAAWPTPVA
jgi:hypothetical protein